MSNKRLHALMVEDLTRSGIPPKLIPKLQTVPLDTDETAAFLNPKSKRVSPDFTAQSYKIPFFDHHGNLLSDGFARLRLLKGKWYEQKSFGKAVPKKDTSFKYNQQTNTVPHLYFPNTIDWPTDKKTGRIVIPTLVITEGEKKAIKAGLCGIHCVALGGVESYQSKKHRIEILEEFKLFDFTSTDVEICYDSDLYSNENVRLAMEKLCGKLSRLQPRSIKYVMLNRSTANGKVGLDDFLADYDSSKEAVKDFNSLPRKEDARMESMGALDQELRYVEADQAFYSHKTRLIYSRHQLFDYLDRLPEVPDPKNPQATVGQAQLWLKMRPEKTNVAAITYDPGQQVEIHNRDGILVNQWRASTHKPKKGSAKPWIEFVRDHLLNGTKEIHKDVLLQWFAYPLQHVGAKINFAPFLYSYKGGVGKNFMMEPFKHIYGENFKRVDGNVLQNSFNDWTTRAQLIFMDEVWVSSYRAERTAAMGQLKSLITNDYIDLNAKYRNRQRIVNKANLVLASNHSDAVVIDPGDRRQFVLHTTEDRLSMSEAGQLKQWYMEGGYEFIHYHLLEKVDVSDFNPFKEAPHTEGREEVISHSADNVSYLMDVLQNSPATIFSKDGVTADKELYRVEEIMAALNSYLTNSNSKPLTISYNSLGRYLSSTGFIKKKIQYRERKSAVDVGKSRFNVRLYAIRNKKKWDAATVQTWTRHYLEHTESARRYMVMDDENVVDLNSVRQEKQSGG